MSILLPFKCKVCGAKVGKDDYLYLELTKVYYCDRNSCARHVEARWERFPGVGMDVTQDLHTIRWNQRYVPLGKDPKSGTPW